MNNQLPYVQQSLTPGEELIHVGVFHWIYTLQAVLNIFWGVLASILIIAGAVYFEKNYGGGFASTSTLGHIQELHPGIRLAAFFVLIMGLFGFASRMVIRSTTEIAITNTRLIYKRGLVARYVGEMNIDRIEGVNVLQTIWGRMFGYGRIMVRGMGVGEVILPPLQDPIAFRRAIEVARTV